MRNSVKAQSRTFQVAEGALDMTKEASNNQITVLTSVAQARANQQVTSMGPFKARLPHQFSETFSREHLSKILREALKIVEGVDGIDGSILPSTESQGTSPTKQ